MLHFVDEIAASSAGSNVIATSQSLKVAEEATDQSFFSEFWEDLKSNVRIQRDHIEAIFSRTKDLSDRRTPSVGRQYRYFLGRYEFLWISAQKFAHKAN